MPPPNRFEHLLRRPPLTARHVATLHALEIASPGDLLLVLGDIVKRTWKQIIYFNSGAHGEEVTSKAPVSIELPETEAFTFDDNVEIISDERGVRIARGEEGD